MIMTCKLMSFNIGAFYTTVLEFIVNCSVALTSVSSYLLITLHINNVFGVKAIG